MKYIVSKGHFESFETLISDLHSLPTKQSTILVGIDGCGCSGKSTFAKQLKESCSDVTLVHMDDFYLPTFLIIKGSPQTKPIGADFDWQRVQEQVLEPLSEDREGYYQRYNWVKDDLDDWHSVPVGGIVV